MKIGLVGGGVMALALARRLLSLDQTVVAYNRSREKLLPLQAIGLLVADDLAGLLAQTPLVLVCLSDAEAIEELLLTDAGIRALSGAKAVLLNLGTIGSAASLRLQQKFGQTDTVYVDMPVSGGVEGALNGTLAGYVGRLPEDAGMLRELIGRITGDAAYFGNNQLAQDMKVLNNLCEAVNLWGAAEAVSIARRLDVDMDTVARGLTVGRGNSVYLNVLLTRLRELPADTAVSHAIRLKDLGLAVKLAQDTGSHAPLAATVAELFAGSAARYGMQADQTACIAHLDAMTEGT